MTLKQILQDLYKRTKNNERLLCCLQEEVGGAGFRFGIQDNIAGEARAFDLNGFDFNFVNVLQDDLAPKILALGAGNELVYIDPAIFAGGSGRFGFLAEDDTAAENRTFNLGAFDFLIGDTLFANNGLTFGIYQGAGIIQMGDTTSINSGLIVTVDIATGQVGATCDTGTVFTFDGTNSYYQMGNNGTTNGTNWYMDDTSRIFEVASTTSMLRLNNATNEYMFGNYDVRSGIFISDSGTGNYMDIYSSQAGAGECDIFLDPDDASISIETSRVGTSNASIYMNLGDDNTIRLNAVAGINTSDPNGVGTAGKWLMGKLIAGVVTADTTRSVEVKIDGVVYNFIVAV